VTDIHLRGSASEILRQILKEFSATEETSSSFPPRIK